MRYAQIVLSVGDFFLPVHFSMVVPHYFHFQRENRTFRFLYYWMWICNESESFGSRSGPCADGVTTTVLGVKSGTARTVTPRQRLRYGVGATRMIPCWHFFAPPAFACSLATAHAAICTLDRRRPSRLASPSRNSPPWFSRSPGSRGKRSSEKAACAGSSFGLTVTECAY